MAPIRRKLKVLNVPVAPLRWLVALGFTLVAATVQANTGAVSVHYASAGPGSSDGYENASVQVRYVILACAGEVTVAAERIRNSVNASAGYWYEGERVTTSAPAPERPLVSFAGTVMHGGQPIGRFGIEAGDALGLGCFSGDTQTVAKLSDHLGAGATQADIRSFLDALHVRVDTTSNPLTNGAVVQSVRAERAQAKSEEQARQRQAEAAKREVDQARLKAEETRKTRQASEDSATQDSSQGASTSTSRPSASAGNYVRSQDGGFYRQNTNGQYQQVTEAEYTAAMNARSEAAREQAKRQDQAARQQQVDQFMDNQRRQDAEAARLTQNMNRQINNLQQSFYAGQQVNSARDRVSSLTTLDGSYASSEELEAAFRRRMDDLDVELRNLERARKSQMEASTEMYFGDADPAVGDLVNSIGGLMNDARQEKEKAAAQEKLRNERERVRAEIQQKRAAMMVQLRKALLAQFPEGDVPLSSQNVPVDTLYFFSYSVDTARITESAPEITLANIFPVHRKGVDMWPFKFAIKKDLPSGAGETTLVGFYANQQLAETMRGSFLKLARESGFRVSELAYAGPNPKKSERKAVSSSPRESQTKGLFDGVSDEELWGASGETVKEEDYW